MNTLTNSGLTATYVSESVTALVIKLKKPTISREMKFGRLKFKGQGVCTATGITWDPEAGVLCSDPNAGSSRVLDG